MSACSVRPQLEIGWLILPTHKALQLWSKRETPTSRDAQAHPMGTRCWTPKSVHLQASPTILHHPLLRCLPSRPLESQQLVAPSLPSFASALGLGDGNVKISMKAQRDFQAFTVVAALQMSSSRPCQGKQIRNINAILLLL